MMDSEQRAVYLQAVEMLGELYGRGQPEWYWLAVMARYFLNCYGEADKEALSEKLRRMVTRKVIERDNYTCQAPECLQRGRLEADHIRLRSRLGPTTMDNETSLCAMDHRFTKHIARRLVLHGEAPDNITVRMGSRTYRNDKLVYPRFDERVLDEDPWAISEARHKPEPWTISEPAAAAHGAAVARVPRWRR